MLPNGDSFIKVADPDYLLHGMSINHPATFVKHSIYQTLGGYHTSYEVAMDYEFLLRAKVAGVQFHTTDQVLATMHLGGKSHVHWRQGLREVKRAKDLHLGHRFAHHLALWIQSFKTAVSLA